MKSVFLAFARWVSSEENEPIERIAMIGTICVFHLMSSTLEIESMNEANECSLNDCSLNDCACNSS